MLGTKNNPCTNIKDIKKVLKKNEIERIYVNHIIDIPKTVLKEIYDKNIKLWVVSENSIDN
jgi:hypothetical protein